MRKSYKLIFAATIFFVSLSTILPAHNVVFVHGRSDQNHCGTGTTDVNDYWGSSKYIDTSYTKYFVGYDGSSDPRSWGSCRAQQNLWSVLYNQCRGGNSCTIICHSAGCYAVDYFFSQYSFVTDNSGYDVNVDFVVAAAAATGGSELADIGTDYSWLANIIGQPSTPMVEALQTSVARSFNHNITAGIPRWHLAGYKGFSGLESASSPFLSGEDDGAVAFHSSCGKNSTGSYDDCEYDGTNWTQHYIWKDTQEDSYNERPWWQLWGSFDAQGYYENHYDMEDVMKRVWGRYLN